VQTATPPATTGPRSLRDDDRLLRAYATTRDPEVRRQLVERYMPLVRYAAARFANGAESFDDLQQVASIGLIKAIDRFDPGNGAGFPSYALPTMLGELRRHFRDRGWTVRPPRGLQEDALKVEQAVQHLHAERGTAPTIDAIARRTGLTGEAVLEARQALQGRHGTSLSGTDDEEQHGLESRLGTVDDGFARVDERQTLAALTATLTRREREIVRLRFDEDLTQAEIGAVVGLSQMHVSRMLRAAIDKLRLAAGTQAAARVYAGHQGG
jgi:RNA polymerase sigma-B factor